MAAIINSAAQVDDNDAPEGIDAPDLQIFMFGLFFIFGGITSLNDVIIPKLKELFTLNFAQALLVQSAFFAAYALFSIPAARIVKRLGYMTTATIGLSLMTIGCLLFVPASASALFGVFLVALFVLAIGITTVQVVANPLISVLGKPRTAHSRLTFAQAFNSLGTTIFPYIGSIVILGSLATVDPRTLSGAALAAYRAAETKTVVNTYLGLPVALVIVAVVVFTRRNRLAHVPDRNGSLIDDFLIFRRGGLLRTRPRFAFGAACIFLYVGAEVAIGSLIVSYLMQGDVLGLDQAAAGKHVPLYWGGALIGRFLGAVALRFVRPGQMLTSVAVGAILLILVSANSSGAVAGYALLMTGLMNSIMFPTIFALGSEGLGPRAAEGSGIIATAIVGGAIIPPLTGMLADMNGLRIALAVPATCYVMIALFGIHARRAVERR